MLDKPWGYLGSLPVLDERRCCLSFLPVLDEPRVLPELPGLWGQAPLHRSENRAIIARHFVHPVLPTEIEKKIVVLAISN